MNNNSSRLRVFYKDVVMKEMFKVFKYSNIHQVPKIEKIVLSMGLGGRDVEKNVEDLTKIAGQKAVITKAKKSISQFSVRTGFSSGAKVTLRKDRMYFFIDRLINVALLNFRSFMGIKLSSASLVGGRVTISFGIDDKKIFHEIYEESMRKEGLNVTICTNCKNKKELKFLLEKFNFPFIGG